MTANALRAALDGQSERRRVSRWSRRASLRRRRRAALRLLFFSAWPWVFGCHAETDSAGPPDTDVFLVEVTSSGGLAAFHPAKNVTDRAGYDNQPAFSADGRRLLFSSVDAGQADLWEVDLGDADRARMRMTRGLDSDYSPLQIPGTETLSFVRVERDGRQRLWGLDPGAPFASPLLAHPDYVGYHAWVDVDHVALYVLGEPPRLVLADRRDGTLRELARGVGRSLQRLPDGSGFSSVEVDPAGGTAWIVERRLTSLEARRVAPALAGSQDHAWTPQGELWMARGTELFCWRSQAQDWSAIADFASDGLRDVTRIAVSPDGRWVALTAIPVD